MTVTQLHELRLSAMAKTLVEQDKNGNADALSFEDRFAFLVEAEWLSRRSSRIKRLVTQARFRFPASVEDIDYTDKKGITKADVKRLASLSYIRRKQNVLLSGPTGVGKTYLSNALGRAACFEGIACRYFRVPDFFCSLSDAKADGTFRKFSKTVTTVPLLILDDWGLRKFTSEESADLFEIFERRYDSVSTIISGQPPCSEWHELFIDPVQADAILDRVVNNAFKFDIQGGSMRKKLAAKNLAEEEPN
jgi:DNA replication protein DnaC